MADAGIVTSTVSILPDEIQKELKGEVCSYIPSVVSEGWYYKLTNVTTSSTDLIAGSFLQTGTSSAAVATGSSPAAITTSDTVQFLFVKNMGVDDDGSTNRTESIYLCFDDGAAAHSATDCIEITTSQSIGLVLNNPTVGHIHAITGQPKGAGTGSNYIQCIVAAIINDE